MAANAGHEEDDNDLLALSLSSSAYRPPRPHPHPHPPPPPLQAFLSQPPPQPPLQLSSTHPLFVPPPQPPRAPPPPPGPSAPSSSHHRRRRNPTQSPLPPIPPPFPWATDQRATVHSFQYLVQNQIHSISGDVQCKRCEQTYKMEFDLREKFLQVANFIVENKGSMHDRAPGVWMNPVLPSCRFCQQENSVKPVMEKKEKNINWLFLLLGQMLGCCTLEQLKYFCKHTKNHRTGAKDRVLYLTYLELCKQVDPNGPFEYRE
ncbi:hypothetical protein RHMOL_Rhmol11G0258600 [Rhododendron molle]|uniref:Uncharacterized protein n=1 Tax=Rhododendron molle TaxID=49168 RepID=A0ACC0LXQ0_RHOML|nr:hypothetical protein RHMOL_Rhmol11G0258600 [Rhododendron molle]